MSSQGSSSLISLRAVTKSYQLGESTVHALRGVDLSIHKGEFMVVLGPSGSGKSTLLNIMGCLDKPSSGSYQLESEEVAHRDFNDLAQHRNQKIGFIFQSFNLIPVLNVLENIELPCLLRSGPQDRAQLRKRVRSMANEVGLSAFLDHRPDQLSGGQRQRVAIARALITEPQIVLADEPTANLDSATSDQILNLMLDLNRQHNVTFVFATHDPRVVERARRSVRIQDGVII